MIFEIKDKKLIWDFRNLKDWMYTFKELWNTRTIRQNALYHLHISNLCKVFADKWIFITNEELHIWLRDKLIKWTYEINRITWKRIVKRKSTTQLSKAEFSQYLKDIEFYLRQTYEISCALPTDINYDI